ncbi:MAG: hypothetical protein HOO67_02700 [Candidatus Peribacteraceae bacterium]|nr:hypothetical protein [Candidatus Peribacteraceae bacterium]
MQRLHPFSFGLGLASGLVVLLLIIGGMRVMGGSSRRGTFTGSGGMNITRMAERFGMTEAELQAELDGGKTMQQIAQEHGVQFGGGRGQFGSSQSAVSSSSSMNGSASSAANSSVSSSASSNS